MTDPRIFSAVLAIIVLLLATACVVLYRKVEISTVTDGMAERLLLYSLWTLALLGIYSATSFAWAGDASDDTLEILRWFRLGLTTAVGIMLLGVLAYWVRLIRRGE